MYNKIDNSKVREKVLLGALDVSNLIISTIGPEGSNVVIDKGPTYYPLITNDGATIARSYKPKSNSYSNIGSKMIIQAAEGTNTNSGDGTSTTTLLTATMMLHIWNLMDNNNRVKNPYDLIKGMNNARDMIVELLNSNSKPIDNLEDIYNIARISSGNNLEIANLIRDSYEIVGKDGVIVLDKSATPDDTVSVTTGYQVDSGMVSQYLANTEDQSKNISRNPRVLVTNKALNKITDLVDISDRLSKLGESLVIFTHEVSDDIIQFYLNNKHILDCNIVRVEGVKSMVDTVLEDIATYTNTILIKEDDNLKELTTNQLGIAERVESSNKVTNIIRGKFDKAKLDSRILAIDSSLKDNSNTKDMLTLLEKRKAMLSAGIVELKVGANSEIELNDKYLRVEDCINAVKVALRKGISRGAGVEYKMIADTIGNSIDKSTITNDEYLGIQLVLLAINSLYATIITKSKIDMDNIYTSIKITNDDIGDKVVYDKNDDIVNDIESELDNNSNLGVIKKNSKMYLCDPYDEGVIDPTSVLIDAVNNSVSVASSYATLEGSIITEDTSI